MTTLFILLEEGVEAFISQRFLQSHDDLVESLSYTNLPYSGSSQTLFLKYFLL